MPRGNPQYTMKGTVPYAEIKSLLPCFYDLPLRCVAEIMDITVTSLFRLRSQDAKAQQWPYFIVRNGVHRNLNWRTIRDLRGKAICSASPGMQTILFQAELKAIQLRDTFLPKERREAVENSSFFPPFPPELEPSTSATFSSQKILIGPGTYQMVTRPMNYMSMDEVQTAVTHMVDIPIYTVTTILRVSVHTLNDVRARLDLKEWPYYRIQRGVYSLTQEEVIEKRAALIASLNPMSVLRMVLCHAAGKVVDQKTHPSIFFEEDMHETSTPSPEKNEQEFTEEKPPPTMSIEELRDWFGILVESPCPQPQAEPWVEEELREMNPIWVDEEHRPPPRSDHKLSDWDRFSPVSPDSQAYWDKLISLSPHAFT